MGVQYALQKRRKKSDWYFQAGYKLSVDYCNQYRGQRKQFEYLYQAFLSYKVNYLLTHYVSLLTKTANKSLWIVWKTKTNYCAAPSWGIGLEMSCLVPYITQAMSPWRYLKPGKNCLVSYILSYPRGEKGIWNQARIVWFHIPKATRQGWYLKPSKADSELPAIPAQRRLHCGFRRDTGKCILGPCTNFLHRTLRAVSSDNVTRAPR